MKKKRTLRIVGISLDRSHPCRRNWTIPYPRAAA